MGELSKQLRSAIVYTGKWISLPIVLALFFICLVKFGAIDSHTNNKLVAVISYFEQILLDVKFTIIEMAVFSVTLLIAYVKSINRGYWLARIGLVKCLFFISFFPLVYAISMNCKIDFIPQNKSAYIASMGYLLGFVALLFLPKKPPSEKSAYLQY
jgi:hypothetical protein